MRPEGATEPPAYTPPVDGTHRQVQASLPTLQAAVGGSVAAVAVAADESFLILAEESGAWRPADGETAADLAQLQASFPTPRDAVASIMDIFPIVRRKDEAKFDGDYRTMHSHRLRDTRRRAGLPVEKLYDPTPCCIYEVVQRMNGTPTGVTNAVNLSLFID